MNFNTRTARAAKSALPYYDRKHAAQMWEDLVKWDTSGRPYTSWSPAGSLNTLKLRLMNSLKWLRDNGTDAQKALASSVSVVELSGKYVLTLAKRRREIPEVENNPTPSLIDENNFANMMNKLKAELIDWMSDPASLYDGNGPTRACFSRGPINIDPAARDELHALVTASGAFACVIRVGRNGIIKVWGLGPEEI